jgi:hypothetical protein
LCELHLVFLSSTCHQSIDALLAEASATSPTTTILLQLSAFRKQIANSAETRVLWLSDMHPELDHASTSPKVEFSGQ